MLNARTLAAMAALAGATSGAEKRGPSARRVEGRLSAHCGPETIVTHDRDYELLKARERHDAHPTRKNKRRVALAVRRASVQ